VQEEAGCLGAAMLGLAATGVHGSIAEASRALARVRAVYEPDARRHARYAERLELYAGLYGALRQIVHGLAAL
jgi:sugar (pentulose or hexulose) kinase